MNPCDSLDCREHGAQTAHALSCRIQYPFRDVRNKILAAWRDVHGVLALAAPTSRHLPTRWLELTRWCLSGAPNAGSQQWAAVARAVRLRFADVTTVVSYSDPAAGHTGALYRACGWLWAPTWTRLRPPPSGNGSWVDGEVQSVKDRWVYPLAADPERESILAVKDDAILRRFPWASYREPRTKRGQPVRGTGGGDWRRFATETAQVMAGAA